MSVLAILGLLFFFLLQMKLFADRPPTFSPPEADRGEMARRALQPGPQLVERLVAFTQGWSVGQPETGELARRALRDPELAFRAMGFLMLSQEEDDEELARALQDEMNITSPLALEDALLMLLQHGPPSLIGSVVTVLGALGTGRSMPVLTRLAQTTGRVGDDARAAAEHICARLGVSEGQVSLTDEEDLRGSLSRNSTAGGLSTEE